MPMGVDTQLRPDELITCHLHAEGVEDFCNMDIVIPFFLNVPQEKRKSTSIDRSFWICGHDGFYSKKQVSSSPDF